MQFVVWIYLKKSSGQDVLATKQALLKIVCFQFFPRFIRLIPLTSDLKKSAGAFAESAWAGAAYYLLWFLLSGQVSVSLMWQIHVFFFFFF